MKCDVTSVYEALVSDATNDPGERHVGEGRRRRRAVSPKVENEKRSLKLD